MYSALITKKAWNSHPENRSRTAGSKQSLNMRSSKIRILRPPPPAPVLESRVTSEYDTEAAADSLAAANAARKELAELQELILLSHEAAAIGSGNAESQLRSLAAVSLGHRRPSVAVRETQALIEPSFEAGIAGASDGRWHSFHFKRIRGGWFER